MVIDKQIYNQFKKGELDAFYEKVYPSLLSIAIKMTPDHHAFLAEDLVQESIFSAYKNREKITSPSHLKAFLYSCVRNEVVTAIRKDVRKQKYVKTLPTIPPDISIEGQMMIQETLDLLYDSIGELPEKYRQIFDLSYVQGLSNAEVAELLNLSLSGIKKRKARFIELMREKMEPSNNIDLLLFLQILALWLRQP